MTEQKEYKFKRILAVYQNLGVATTWKFVPDLEFEPDEVRILQYGIRNDSDPAALTGGLLECTEIRDFNLIICATDTISVARGVRVTCPTKGKLSSLTFKFVTEPGGAPQPVLDGNDIWLVLEFLKH